MAFQIKNKVSFIATIAVILIVGIGGYLLLKLKQGPYPVSSFVSMSYKWGTGDTLINSYSSKNGVYQYLDNHDSLVRKNVKLNANNIIFLHNRANEADLWNIPAVVNPPKHQEKTGVLRYEIEFKYEEKTKNIVFFTDEMDNHELGNNMAKLIAAIEQTIKDAEERSGD